MPSHLQLKDDQKFQEFLEVHKNRTTKATWKNDTLAVSEERAGADEASEAAIVYEESDSDAAEAGEDSHNDEDAPAQTEGVCHARCTRSSRQISVPTVLKLMFGSRWLID